MEKDAINSSRCAKGPPKLSMNTAVLILYIEYTILYIVLNLVGSLYLGICPKNAKVSKRQYSSNVES